MPTSSNNRLHSFRRMVRWVIVLIWCLMIFVASHKPDLKVSDYAALDLVLRKLGHMVVFGVLAWLLALALSDSRLGARRMLVLAGAWLATLAYAVSDEWHQTFIEGRSGQLSDVVIDMVGATLSLLVLRHIWRGHEHTRRGA